jgi:steroid 5-alpha reductase family enzyme
MILQELYTILLWVEFGAAVVVFVLLFFISAPYGRYNRTDWGPTVQARAAWIVMELPAVLVIAGLFFSHLDSASPAAVIFLVIWQVHYLYRTFVYPLRIRGAERPFPILLIVMAFIFNVMNGCINGYYLFAGGHRYPLSWLADPRFIIGVTMFLAGCAIHIRSDSLLRQLRKPHNGTYQIPSGGWFRYVSSPNYLGEIVEWSGWALLTWSLPGLAFALFTAANLIPRARANHHWYLKHFPHYPKERKILIPYIL